MQPAVTLTIGVGRGADLGVAGAPRGGCRRVPWIVVTRMDAHPASGAPGADAALMPISYLRYRGGMTDGLPRPGSAT